MSDHGTGVYWYARRPLPDPDALPATAERTAALRQACEAAERCLLGQGDPVAVVRQLREALGKDGT